jgi:hypothetical protein
MLPLTFDHSFSAPPVTDNKVNHKSESCIYIISGSARRASANHVSSSLALVATAALASPTAQISKPAKHPKKKCCADSGATDHMFPDRATFISYHPTPGKFIQLGDGTLLDDKVNMDIVFGDCLSIGRCRYALVLVDVATRYCWVYDMQALTSNEIISCLEAFRCDADRVPKLFHSDFDKKLLGGKALCWIQEAKSRIIAAQTIVRMARAYITEKQVGREFWFCAIKGAARMCNQVPGRLGRKLTTPFELVYGVKPDASTWFELFSVGFFPHDSVDGSANMKMQPQTLMGIAIGCDDQSNTILFYNLLTKQYYCPPIYKLDESRLPISCFPKSVCFDGGLTCGLVRNRTDLVTEYFPPGTRITIQHEAVQCKGTISNVPLPFLSNIDTAAVTTDDDSVQDRSTKYVIHLDDGTTIEKEFQDLAPTIHTSTGDVIASQASNPFEPLPYILKRNAKITIDHNGAFHKGYLEHSPEGGFQFSACRAPYSKKALWSVPLPDFTRNWYSMVAENIIIPGHTTVSSFLHPNSSNNARLRQEPASHVSTISIESTPSIQPRPLNMVEIVPGRKRGVRVTRSLRPYQQKDIPRAPPFWPNRQSVAFHVCSSHQT